MNAKSVACLQNRNARVLHHESGGNKSLKHPRKFRQPQRVSGRAGEARAVVECVVVGVTGVVPDGKVNPSRDPMVPSDLVSDRDGGPKRRDRLCGFDGTSDLRWRCGKFQDDAYLLRR